MNQDWNDPKSQLQQCCLTLRELHDEDPDIPIYKYDMKYLIMGGHIVSQLICGLPAQKNDFTRTKQSATHCQ